MYSELFTVHLWLGPYWHIFGVLESWKNRLNHITPPPKYLPMLVTLHLVAKPSGSEAIFGIAAWQSGTIVIFWPTTVHREIHLPQTQSCQFTPPTVLSIERSRTSWLRPCCFSFDTSNKERFRPWTPGGRNDLLRGLKLRGTKCSVTQNNVFFSECTLVFPGKKTRSLLSLTVCHHHYCCVLA